MAGNRIRAIRLERAKVVPAAFTLMEVSQRVGVSVNTLRSWEAGEARPRQRHARLLARALGVQVEDLALDDDSSH